MVYDRAKTPLLFRERRGLVLWGSGKINRSSSPTNSNARERVCAIDVNLYYIRPYSESAFFSFSRLAGAIA